MPSQPPRVAILVYHHIDETPGPRTLSPAQFESHLQMLRDQGYYILHPEEFESYLEGWMDIPDRSVLITVDDGYDSLYTRGLPLLRKYRAPAMAFVVTRFFDDPTKGAYTPHLSREQARELVASGLLSLQSHSDDGHALMYDDASQTTMHPRLIGPGYLPGLDRQETGEEYLQRIRDDLARSRRELLQVGMKPWQLTHFAFPYGASNAQLVETASSLGFRYFYSTALGLAQKGESLTSIPRINVGETYMSADRLRAELERLFADRN